MSQPQELSKVMLALLTVIESQDEVYSLVIGSERFRIGTELPRDIRFLNRKEIAYDYLIRISISI